MKCTLHPEYVLEPPHACTICVNVGTRIDNTYPCTKYLPSQFKELCLDTLRAGVSEVEWSD